VDELRASYAITLKLLSYVDARDEDAITLRYMPPNTEAITPNALSTLHSPHAQPANEVFAEKREEDEQG
jgi:hypothetical protein